ncbi:hypothetical protein FO519_001627 [Halicephalobus sp. NKZ332]|nr:hypothetical protein FO519_001627 [Halicephalobus sp. NKZ332]
MLTIFLFLAYCIPRVNGGANVLEYSNDPNGPSHWPGYCMTGTKQSPVNIDQKDVVPVSLDDLVFTNYEKEGNIQIVNVGETLQIRGFDSWGSNQPTISGGGLRYNYTLLQIHFHWSDSDNHGSEHTFDGTHYPLEIHFVHTKENKTLQEALLDPEGLMALGIFGILSFDNYHFATITPGLEMLENTAPGTNISFTMAPERFFPPEKQVFYRYNGSLTTPNCDEVVIWTILSAPIGININQLSVMRAVRKADHLDYSANVRSIQSLNGRVIQIREESNILENHVSSKRYTIGVHY